MDKSKNKVRAPMNAQARTGAQRGFGLVEVMVGLLIGMLTAIVMMQVFSASEGWKRTTTGGSDAQTNGAIALHLLQRDIRESGHGIRSLSLLNCNLTVWYDAAKKWTINGIGPVMINHASITGGDGGSDTLLVISSNTNGAPEGELVQAQSADFRTYTVSSPTAPAAGAGTYAVGDWVIAEVQPTASPCNVTMEKVTGTSAPSNLSVAAGTADMLKGLLFNLGPTPKIQAYAVRGGNLTACDYLVNNCGDASLNGDASVWVPIASNVVAVRAQYGRDTTATMDAIVDVYDQAAPTTACLWSRVSALRVGLVARSALLERDAVTGNGTGLAPPPSWAGSATQPFDMAQASLATGQSWQNFRYKVFETTVPQRNMSWMGAQSGC
jgi:type IV pilus assembly protein PilW